MAKMFYWLDAEYIDSTSKLDIDLINKNNSKITYKVDDELGAIKGLILEGSNLVVKNNRVVSGSIEEISFLAGGSRTILHVEALDLSGKAIQAAISAGTTWKLLTSIFSGNDKISVRGAETDVFTGAGDDVVKSTAHGYNRFYDGPGADRYIGSSISLDTWLSYQDADLYKGFGSYQGVNVDLARQRAVDPWGDVDTLRNIEVVLGSDRGDVIKGAADWESFCGMAGNDLIDGRGGGGDRVDYRAEFGDGGRRGVMVDLTKGTALDSFGDKDTLRNIEAVRGTRFNDTLIGDGKQNTLEGAEGRDVLTGNGGADEFRFRDGFGQDTITDFTIGLDTIRLNELSALFDGFDSLEITQSGRNAVIRFEDMPREKITLLDVQADELSASDFLF